MFCFLAAGRSKCFHITACKAVGRLLSLAPEESSLRGNLSPHPSLRSTMKKPTHRFHLRCQLPTLLQLRFIHAMYQDQTRISHIFCLPPSSPDNMRLVVTGWGDEERFSSEGKSNGWEAVVSVEYESDRELSVPVKDACDEIVTSKKIHMLIS